MQRRGYRPADYPTAADIGDERRVAELSQDAHVGDVSDPQLVGLFSSETAFDHVGTVIRCPGRTRDDQLTAASGPFWPGEFHQSGGLVPADLPADTEHRLVHLPGAVDAVVVLVDPLRRNLRSCAGSRSLGATRGSLGAAW